MYVLFCISSRWSFHFHLFVHPYECNPFINWFADRRKLSRRKKKKKKKTESLKEFFLNYFEKWNRLNHSSGLRCLANSIYFYYQNGTFSCNPLSILTQICQKLSWHVGQFTNSELYHFFKQLIINSPVRYCNRAGSTWRSTVNKCQRVWLVHQ